MSFGLYIHIPFCVRKCNYCDFLSSSYNDDIKTQYIEALINEISLNAEICKAECVDTIYIGGGTPSVLDSKHIVKIIEYIYQKYNVSSEAEVTIEVNPGTVNRLKFCEYLKSGINRISMGLQSADNDELFKLGRIHTFEQFLEEYSIARSVGFKNINIDVMSAIPNQTYDSYISTLNKVADLNPEHISSYSLIIEEGTEFYNNVDKLNLPDEDTERRMYYATSMILGEYGYNRYEISNYSKPGFESRHNTAYWKNGSYIGAGIGAASYYKRMRYKNIEDINKYIKIVYEEDINRLHIDKEILTDTQMMEEYMFLGLRCMTGISIKGFFDRFNKDMFDVYSGKVDRLINSGHLRIEGDMLRLTENGIDVSNRVLAEFLI